MSFERNVTVSSGRYQCFRPEDSSSQLYIDWKGDQKYLCFEDGILKFMSMKNNKTEKCEYCRGILPSFCFRLAKYYIPFMFFVVYLCIAMLSPVLLVLMPGIVMYVCVFVCMYV